MKTKKFLTLCLTIATLLVLNSFIKKRSITKSSDLRSDLFVGHASNPYNNAGIHLLWMSCISKGNNKRLINWCTYAKVTLNTQVASFFTAAGVWQPITDGYWIAQTYFLIDLTKKIKNALFSSLVCNAFFIRDTCGLNIYIYCYILCC